MITEIVTMARQTGRETGKDEFSQRVIRALEKVPRHEFVPDYQQAYAYENRPLPIGCGQTISQPYIVALMTDLLELTPQKVVLEIGTGSGYQAAILAELVQQVYSVEIIEKLAEEARERLQQLGYQHVHIKIADGYYGWVEQAPFDAIIVTAAATYVPPPLIQQLKEGGRLIIPIGQRFHIQYLTLLEKSLTGQIETREVLPVAFVPLTGKR